MLEVWVLVIMVLVLVLRCVWDVKVVWLVGLVNVRLRLMSNGSRIWLRIG